jgi:3-hydroxyisobutyrate dehydrogenase
MAANLARAGHRVLGYDLDADRLAAAAYAGVVPASSAFDAASHADVVVTMLRTGAQTEALVAGESGLAASLPDHQELDLVVMSTVEPELITRMARHTAGSLRIVDAPVSGGVRGAEAGTLAIMVAGAADALARVRPLFEVLGSSTFELGTEPGLGQAAKLANQVMMVVAMAGTVEALALSRDYGLDDEAVCAVVAAGTGSSWVLENWPWMRSLWEEHVPGNALDILIKDVRTVLAQTETRELELPVTAMAFSRLLETWKLAV